MFIPGVERICGVTEPDLGVLGDEELVRHQALELELYGHVRASRLSVRKWIVD